MTACVNSALARENCKFCRPIVRAPMVLRNSWMLGAFMCGGGKRKPLWDKGWHALRVFTIDQ